MAGTNLHQPETTLKILETTFLWESQILRKPPCCKLIDENQTAANVHSFILQSNIMAVHTISYTSTINKTDDFYFWIICIQFSNTEKISVSHKNECNTPYWHCMTYKLNNMPFHKPNTFYLFVKKDYVTKPTPNAWRLQCTHFLHKLCYFSHFVAQRNHSLKGEYRHPQTT